MAQLKTLYTHELLCRKKTPFPVSFTCHFSSFSSGWEKSVNESSMIIFYVVQRGMMKSNQNFDGIWAKAGGGSGAATVLEQGSLVNFLVT